VIAAMLVALAAEADAWWWGLATGIVLGVAVARWDQLLAVVARLVEAPRPAWPAQAPTSARSHLRLIWSATPAPPPYDFEREPGDVA
jgi:hypothetical protein